MGKPAARLTDTTAHGGTIVGPGCPMVLIGKMPAATMGDMHICPMCNGPVPHVGGPISLGSTGVFFGKKPAARVSDICVCVGPPSMPVVGHFQTLIGEVGGAGGGAAAALAATAVSAVTNPGSVMPMEAPEYTQEILQNHQIMAEVVDSAGLPLVVPYEIKDPAGATLRGMTTAQGLIFHGGYAQAGGYEVSLKALGPVEITQSKIEPGKSFDVQVTSESFTSEDRISICLLWNTQEREKLAEVKTLDGASLSNPVSFDFPMQPAQAFADGPVMIDQVWVLVRSGQWVAISKPKPVQTEMQLKCLYRGKALANAQVSLTLAEGIIHNAQSNSAGLARFEKLPAGRFACVVEGPEGACFEGLLEAGDSSLVHEVKLTRRLTLKDVADHLIKVEAEAGYEHALLEVECLDYKQLADLAHGWKTEKSQVGEKRQAKNDPHLLPSRFLLLPGVTDKGLKAKGHLDDFPYALHADAKHVISVFNLSKSLAIILRKFYEVGKAADSSQFSEDVLADLHQYLGLMRQGQGDECKKLPQSHVVEKSDTLKIIAERMGLRSWRLLYEANQAEIGESQDALPIGITLKAPPSGQEKVKQWLEEEGFDSIYLSSHGYHYPGKYLSLSLLDEGTGKPIKWENPERFEVYLRDEMATEILSFEVKVGDELDCVVPDHPDLGYGVAGYQLSVDGRPFIGRKDYLAMRKAQVESASNVGDMSWNTSEDQGQYFVDAEETEVEA